MATTPVAPGSWISEASSTIPPPTVPTPYVPADINHSDMALSSFMGGILALLLIQFIFILCIIFLCPQRECIFCKMRGRGARGRNNNLREVNTEAPIVSHRYNNAE